jgi:hypothetical protein
MGKTVAHTSLLLRVGLKGLVQKAKYFFYKPRGKQARGTQVIHVSDNGCHFLSFRLSAKRPHARQSSNDDKCSSSDKGRTRTNQHACYDYWCDNVILE